MAHHATNCPKFPWMIDFHSTKEGVPNCQLKAAYADNFTQHLINLNIESEVPKCKLTGIIGTFGPSCDTSETLEKMMEAGMTMLQLRMCFCANEECNNPMKLIRAANDNYSRKIGRVYPLAVGIDIRGPEIRTGSLKDHHINEITLQKGNAVCLTTDPVYEEHVTEDMIFVDYSQITEVIEPGDSILLNNGEIRLSALEIVGSVLKCIIETAGRLMSFSTVTLPGVPIALPPLSEKDLKDIKYAQEQGVDALFLSGIGGIKPIQYAREILGEAAQNIMVLAKIDNVQAIDNIDEILKKADGIIIDRGALVTEILSEKLFLAQKSLIAKCNKAGKPVVCTSHVLDSMVINAKPTSSEITDVANAILDGVDCFILNHETTVGEHPVRSIEVLATICKEAEAAVYQRQIFNDLTLPAVISPIEPIYAVSIAAVEASLKCNAAVIIVLTVTGRSASVLARYRPRCPIIAVTRFGHVARKLQLYRAVEPVQYILPAKGEWNKEVDERIQLGMTWGKLSGYIRAGDAVITVNGSRPGAGFTNLLKVVYASEFDALPPEGK